MNRNAIIGMAVGLTTVGIITTAALLPPLSSEPSAPPSCRALLDNNSLDVEVHLVKAIESEFKHPDHVEVMNLGSFVKESTLISDSLCTWSAYGMCSAPNSFGIKSRFYFKVNYLYDSNGLKIESVEIADASI